MFFSFIFLLLVSEMQNNPFACISDACVHRNMQYVAADVLFQLMRQASEETQMLLKEKCTNY